MPLVPDDLSEEQLKWGYWFVTHKLLLRRILTIALIVFSAINLGYSGYSLTLDVLNARNRLNELALLSTLQLNPAISKAQAPKALSFANAQVIVTQGKYDFLSTVGNPNDNFAARFTYRFVAGNFASETVRGFVLPGEQKLIAQLGVVSPDRPTGAYLEVVDVAWQRIDKHVYPDWKAFVGDRLNFKISDTAYTPSIELEKDKPFIGKTSFTIANATGFGYYGVRVLVVIYRGPAAVGVNSATIAVLPPGESRSGEVTWYEDYGAVTEVKVIPEVDILNDAVYIRSR